MLHAENRTRGAGKRESPGSPPRPLPRTNPSGRLLQPSPPTESMPTDSRPTALRNNPLIFLQCSSIVQHRPPENRTVRQAKQSPRSRGWFTDRSFHLNSFIYSLHRHRQKQFRSGLSVHLRPGFAVPPFLFRFFPCPFRRGDRHPFVPPPTNPQGLSSGERAERGTVSLFISRFRFQKA